MRSILTILMTLILSSGFSQTKDSTEVYSERLNEQIEILKMQYDSIQTSLDSLDKIISEFDNQPLIKILNGNFDYDSLNQEYLVYMSNHSENIKANSFPVERFDTSKIIGYGVFLHPIYRVKKPHNGIDIPTSKGENVKSTIKGVVIEKKEIKSGYGNYIIISTLDSIKIILAHLDTILVDLNDEIEIGQVIGTVGNSGMSTGIHLHYEIWVDEKPINPIFTVWGKLDRETIESIYKRNIIPYD
jgi:murein DD-endopeptidase MepM/ murein hydrolase activator NlpD